LQFNQKTNDQHLKKKKFKHGTRVIESSD